MAFARILGDWKNTTGWTEERISNAVGVSRSAVNQWLNDKAVPDLKQLKPVGKLIGWDWRDLAATILGESTTTMPPRAKEAELVAKAHTLTDAELDRLIVLANAMFPPQDGES